MVSINLGDARASLHLIKHTDALAHIEEWILREEMHQPSHFEPKFKIFDIIKWS